MTNSGRDPVRAFHERFRALWRAGQGRGALTGKRQGHTGEAQWNAPEFCDALEKAGGAVSPEMVARWHDGRNVPRKPQMDAILRVFFSVPVPAAKLRFDLDAADCEAFRALWTQAHTARQSRRKPEPQAPANQPEDWWLEGGHEFPDLVTFRVYQPIPVETGTNHYEVRSSLIFGRATPEDGDLQIDLSLSAAWLEIPATSFQPSPDGTIGDPPRERPNVRKQPNGRTKIVAPKNGDILEGEAIGIDDPFLRVEPAARRGGPLAPRITAPMTDLNLSATLTETGAPVDLERGRVLKLLLAKGCRRDDATGRIVLAERLLTRKAARA